MNKNRLNKNRKSGRRASAVAVVNSGIKVRPQVTTVQQRDGFASSKDFVAAVSKIYSQEIDDIDRFVKLTERRRR